MKSQDGSPRASAASRLRAGQPVSSRAPCVHAGPHGASKRRFEAATEPQSAALRLRSATALAARPLATRFPESPECRFSAPQPAAGGLRPAPRASPSLTACKALACLHAVLQVLLAAAPHDFAVDLNRVSRIRSFFLAVEGGVSHRPADECKSDVVAGFRGSGARGGHAAGGSTGAVRFGVRDVGRLYRHGLPALLCVLERRNKRAKYGEQGDSRLLSPPPTRLCHRWHCQAETERDRPSAHGRSRTKTQRPSLVKRK